MDQRFDPMLIILLSCEDPFGELCLIQLLRGRTKNHRLGPFIARRVIFHVIDHPNYATCKGRTGISRESDDENADAKGSLSEKSGICSRTVISVGGFFNENRQNSAEVSGSRFTFGVVCHFSSPFCMSRFTAPQRGVSEKKKLYTLDRTFAVVLRGKDLSESKEGAVL